jgi:hypothetical protein
MEKHLADFRAAGGRELYVVFSMNDLLQRHSPALIIPIEPGTDVNKLEAMAGHEGPQAPKITERVGDALLVGTEEQRQSLRQAHENQAKQPAGRNQELLAALSAMTAAADANNAPAVQLAVAPSEESRKAFEQLAPTLPPQLGGGSMTDVTRGLRWLTVSIAPPPKPSVRVTLQARDAAAVDSLDKTIHAALDAAGKATEAEVAKHPKNSDVTMLRAVAKLIPSLAPTRGENNQLVLSIDDAKLADLTGVVSTGMVLARGNALRVQSMSNIRQLLMASLLWANDHKGQWPDDLAAAAKAYDAGPVLANPRGGKAAYKYIKPPKDVKSPAERIVIYETDVLDANGLDVGYMDGHVEFMSREEFEKQLKAQQGAGDLQGQAK